ncbi:ER membrane protein complex subunit 5-like [Hydra vulgaris]|uniref:ER membrane protein complex subunit 5-like n=1 Tax=Hydra vulgaris TaxID=6087 RepID=UPI0032EA0877
MDVLGRCLVTVGIISLIHCGYSAIQYRTYLKLIEEEFTSVPIDGKMITLQVLVSVLISIFGIIRIAGELKDIHAAAELASKSWETLGNRASFFTFTHRGQQLFQDK